MLPGPALEAPTPEASGGPGGRDAFKAWRPPAPGKRHLGERKLLEAPGGPWRPLEAPAPGGPGA